MNSPLKKLLLLPFALFTRSAKVFTLVKFIFAGFICDFHFARLLFRINFLRFLRRISFISIIKWKLCIKRFFNVISTFLKKQRWRWKCTKSLIVQICVVLKPRLTLTEVSSHCVGWCWSNPQRISMLVYSYSPLVSVHCQCQLVECVAFYVRFCSP